MKCTQKLGGSEVVDKVGGGSSDLQGCEEAEEVQVQGNLPEDVRALHFDSHVAASGFERGPVHLADTRTRNLGEESPRVLIRSQGY